MTRWLLGPGPAQRLAALRILTGGFVLVYLLVAVSEFARLTRQSAQSFEPIGLAGVLDRPLDAGPFWVLYLATLAVGVAFTAGWRFRFSGPAFALLVLLLTSYHSSFGQLLHFEHLFTLHLLVLGLSPAADAWSFSGSTDAPEPHVCYGWPVRLMALMTVATYVIAAITKLRVSGLEWIDDTTITNHVAYSATRLDLLGSRTPPLASFALEHRWVLAPAGAAALALELASPLALVHPVARRGWVVGVLAMHLGIVLLLGVWFPYQGLGFALAPLYRTERLGSVVSSYQRRARATSGGFAASTRFRFARKDHTTTQA